MQFVFQNEQLAFRLQTSCDVLTSLDYLNRAVQCLTNGPVRKECPREGAGIVVDSSASTSGDKTAGDARSTADYRKVFAELGVPDCRQVLPCSFEEYLHLVEDNERAASLQTSEIDSDKRPCQGVLSDFAADVCVLSEDIDPCPEKKAKLVMSEGKTTAARSANELALQPGHVVAKTKEIHDLLQSTGSFPLQNPDRNVSLDLFTQCATHPRVANLICEVIKDKLEILGQTNNVVSSRDEH